MYFSKNYSNLNSNEIGLLVDIITLIIHAINTGDTSTTSTTGPPGTSPSTTSTTTRPTPGKCMCLRCTFKHQKSISNFFP